LRVSPARAICGGKIELIFMAPARDRRRTVLAWVSRLVGRPPQQVMLRRKGGRYAAQYTVASAGQWDLAIEIDGVGLGFASQTRFVVR
jgi:hypothetical protein